MARTPDGPPDLDNGLLESDWSEPGGPGLLGFASLPDPRHGRHYDIDEPSGLGSRLTALLSAAGLSVVALGVAMVAVVVGGVSMLLGVLAIGRADDARAIADRAAERPTALASERAAPPQAVVPPLPPPTDTAPSAVAVSPSIDPDRLDPAARYELTYDTQALPVQARGCDGTGVDLDEPRVLPPDGADLTYRSCVDGQHLDFEESARFAVVADRDTTAGQCADAIRTDPGVGWVTPTPDVTVCALTVWSATDVAWSGADAGRAGQKIVRLHVDSVAADGTVRLALTAWMVPQE